jgi:uncharacterized protein
VICPKCQNLMQTVDRRGVHIEQCQGCRGIFLDRGELEQIAGAEHTFYAAPAQPQYRSDSPPPYGGSYGYDPRHQGHYRDSPPPHGSHRGHRRKSFLEELFD